MRAKIGAARFLPGRLYRQITLRFHAASLASPHDREGQFPLDTRDFRRLFLENTPWRSYTARARAAFSADYRERLHRVEVPTLVVTPSHDELIGPDAAAVMLDGIPDANEAVLDRTGHMFRFTHPHTYADVVESFIVTRVERRLEAATACSARPGTRSATPHRSVPHNTRRKQRGLVAPTAVRGAQDAPIGGLLSLRPPVIRAER